MATASIDRPEPIQPPATVTLELSEREALVLHTILRRIAGPPAGPRGDTARIEAALQGLHLDADVRNEYTRGDHRLVEIGYITMADEWPEGYDTEQ